VSLTKPYLKKLNASDLPSDLRIAREKSIELRGDGTFFEVFGNNPKLYRWYVTRFYKELFYAEHIDIKIKELLRFRLSTIHGCRFCNQGNKVAAIEAGLSEPQIDNINDYENGPFNPMEKTVLRLADEMSLIKPNGQLTESIYKELRIHFDDATILELGMIMGVLSGIAKFIFAFNLVEKEENCPFNHSQDLAT